MLSTNAHIVINLTMLFWGVCAGYCYALNTKNTKQRIETMQLLKMNIAVINNMTNDEIISAAELQTNESQCSHEQLIINMLANRLEESEANETNEVENEGRIEKLESVIENVVSDLEAAVA